MKMWRFKTWLWTCCDHDIMMMTCHGLESSPINLSKNKIKYNIGIMGWVQHCFGPNFNSIKKEENLIINWKYTKVMKVLIRKIKLVLN